MTAPAPGAAEAPRPSAPGGGPGGDWAGRGVVGALVGVVEGDHARSFKGEPSRIIIS